MSLRTRRGDSFSDLPIVATDNDRAGQAATERAYWVLAELGHDPLHATLPDGTDPADLLAEEGRRCSLPHCANRSR